MNVYISGGCKNGKSDFAQAAAIKLANGGKRYYVATMVPQDAEDRESVAIKQAAPVWALKRLKRVKTFSPA